MTRDDRGIIDPGVIRDRFLSEFALALVEGVQLQEFLDWSVAQLGRILEVDRFTLFLFGPGTPGESLVVRTSWAADGVESVPVTIPLSEHAVSLKLRQFDPVVIEDVATTPDLGEIAETLRVLGTKSVLAVPIGIDGDASRLRRGGHGTDASRVGAGRRRVSRVGRSSPVRGSQADGARRRAREGARSPLGALRPRLRGPALDDGERRRRDGPLRPPRHPALSRSAPSRSSRRKGTRSSASGATAARTRAISRAAFP